MKVCRLTTLLCACAILLQFSAGCKKSGGEILNTAAPAASTNPVNTAVPAAEKKLTVRSIGSGEFKNSIDSAREYEAGGFIKAGVIPHHTAGAPLISGFFRLAAADTGSYDTVVIVAPNHAGDLGDVILSRRGWDVNGGVGCDTEIADALLELKIDGAKIIENDKRVEEDHSASVLIPYINYYLPGAKVVPVLVSRTLTLDSTINFAEAVSRVISASNKSVLLVCSIDFSHYLVPENAARNDVITASAIISTDYKQIHDFSNEYIDSPASLIVFLKYLSELGITAQIIDNTDASEFLGPGVRETTSYFVILGCDE